MISLFSKHGGIKGLADSLFSGVAGSVFRCVGIDYRSKPGIFKAHQKLIKHSPEDVNAPNELCNASVNASDGSKLWFSSESGKVWREVNGAYTHVFTNNTDPDDVFDNDLETEFEDDEGALENVGWQYIGGRINPSGADFPKIEKSIRKLSNTSPGVSIDSFFLPAPDSAFLQNRVIMVIAVQRSGGTNALSSLSFAGEAMTRVANLSSSPVGTFRADVWVLINPTAQGGQITGAWSGAVQNGILHAFQLSGADQTTPFDGFVHNGATSSNKATLDIPLTGAKQVRIGLVMSTDSSGGDEITHVQGEGRTELLSGTFGTSGAGSDWDTDGSDSSVFFETLGDEMTRDAEEHYPFVYWATEKVLWRIRVSDLGEDWETAREMHGVFKNGSDAHPMTVQNLSLFIGDENIIAEVNDQGVFILETFFKLPESERITAVVPFDTDLLVGTLDKSLGRVLRWDTVSESWSAQDEVFEKGVTAFIRDDNYVYVVAGNIGRIYFYNGERMEPFVRIPGEWSNQKLATIHRNSTEFYLGVPIFGLTNVSGNPQLQGIYGLGSYGRNYAKTLSLDFPVPTDEFEGVSIGAIIVDDVDLYVSWKDGEDVGIAKLDWTKKYNGYLETTALSGTKDRHLIKTLTKAVVPHLPLPENTGITLGYKKKYEASFTDMQTMEDEDRMMTYNRDSVPKVANLQLRVGLQVNGNDTPSCEDLLVGIKTPE